VVQFSLVSKNSLFLIEVSGLCTCSPSSGFIWNGIGEIENNFFICFRNGVVDVMSTRAVHEQINILDCGVEKYTNPYIKTAEICDSAEHFIAELQDGSVFQESANF